MGEPSGGAKPQISIHAPRGGSDNGLMYCTIRMFDFNPRSPWGERRPYGAALTTALNFNPRSPWGERPGAGAPVIADGGFQSTLPVGGATSSTIKRYRTPSNFNPRSPWGERREYERERYVAMEFQSTLPVGGATIFIFLSLPISVFQSTLPVGGATTQSPIRRPGSVFQSTLPVGGATIPLSHFTPQRQISIHAPRGGSDEQRSPVGLLNCYFNPRSPWGERLFRHRKGGI